MTETTEKKPRNLINDTDAIIKIVAGQSVEDALETLNYAMQQIRHYSIVVEPIRSKN